MNFQIKKILLLCLVSTLSIVHAQEKSTSLIIETNRGDAGLFFDDKFIGTGNQFTLNIENGSHTIYISENIKDWDAEIIMDTIDVEYSNQLKLDYNFKEKILINTDPQDVSVYEKDSLMGFTPAYIESGFTELQLKKMDYQNINVSFSEVSGKKKPELIYNGEPPKTPFYGSTLFTVLVGTAIALGAATAYYKLEADDLYDEYLITGDQGLLDNIDHYDGQSAGTLIGMELCVGAVIYFFLTE